jgi:predicted phage baseplate assembly protein
MGLQPPNLDDRRFQDLVDDAKRIVQQRCPEWSDHNVSDPGVTLIETFAFMVDQLLYRLNRVPDRLYVTFLDLIGLSLHPPAAATADLTFWLSAPRPHDVVVPQDTEVSTQRTEDGEAVVFFTTEKLVIPPRELTHVLTRAHRGNPVQQTRTLLEGTEFACFSEQPVPGDSMLIGLSGPAPSCVVTLRFDCNLQGRGVDPRWPPLIWEAWDGIGWVACEHEDETGGLNRPGDVVLHLPKMHAASEVAEIQAGWLRCRVVGAEPGQPFYGASPTIRSVSAFTIGGTAEAVHAEVVRDEVLGLSEGTPGQTFALSRRPVVPGGPPFVVEVASGQGWERWPAVDSFAGVGEDEKVVRLEYASGEVQFGPAVREPDGTLRRYGALPPKGAPLRVPVYRTGGGPAGNVRARALNVLRTTIPSVARVENRRAAADGFRGETVEEAKLRAPLLLRNRFRAVTSDDYEELVREAAPIIARVHCVPGQGPDQRGVRVLVVPSATPDAMGRLRFADLRPSATTLARITGYLDERRIIGERVLVEPPFYMGVSVEAKLTPRPGNDPGRLCRAALERLYRYLNPVTGGPDGTGWPFGRPVQAVDIHAVLQRLDGIEMVDDVQLIGHDPETGSRGQPQQQIILDKHALVFSFEHEVAVREGGVLRARCGGRS